MVKSFISYRRADAAQVTGRIYDKLVGIYGHDNVFKDVDSIPLGTDFRHVIEDSLGKCNVLLAVIGPAWLTATDENGLRRIDNPLDYVRIEIEFALKQNTLAIPLLVGDATMPKAEHLPESLRAFAFLNASPVRPDPDFHRDMDRVVRAIGGGYPSSSRSKLASNLTLIDASLDSGDSPYKQNIENGTKIIRPKVGDEST
jgi:hypothetical protein